MQSQSMSSLLLSGFKHVDTHIFKDGPVSDINHDGTRYELLMQYDQELPITCPKCGGKLYSHGTRKLHVTDTPLFGAPAKLQLTIPRRRCQDCGAVWTPDLVDIDENHKMTKRSYKKMANLALKHSFVDIANEYGVTNNTVKNVFVEYIRENKDKLQFKTPAFLGLDEIKIKKIGEVTVVTDLEHKTLYDMMLGRNQPSLTAYFSQMRNPENVAWVCTDMYRPFEKSIRQALPNARWVIDHFHVVAYANKAMDGVRIKVQGNLSKSERINTKKGLAYTLRTRLKDLTPDEAAKIKRCRQSDVLRPLAVAFDLKEDFFNIYDNNMSSKDKAQQAFADWEASIPSDDVYEDFRVLAGTVHNFYEQIFNFWDCPITITNGFTECINRIIRENNVRGRGNSFDILRSRTLYRHANLERIEESGMLLGPQIPTKGPVFHYEELSCIQDKVEEDDKVYFNSFDYDPMIGLIPGVNYDPDTKEIYDETLFDDEEEEEAQEDQGTTP